MMGSGLHATVLIGRCTLIKTEKCLLPPSPQDEQRGAEGSGMGSGAGDWGWRDRNGPLKNMVLVGGRGGALIVFN